MTVKKGLVQNLLLNLIEEGYLKNQLMKPALKVALIYGVISIIYISFSDHLVDIFFRNNQDLFLRVQTYKGWFFVALSSWIIFHLVYGSIKKINENDLKFKALFNQAYQYIGLLTPEGKLVDVNQEALDVIKRKKEEVLGLYLWDAPWWAHSFEEREKLRNALEKALKGETVKIETTNVDYKGDILFVDFSLKPFFNADGNIIMIIPEGRDVTADKMNLIRIEESENKFRKLAEYSVFGVYLLQDGLFRYVNPKFAEMFGYKREEIENKFTPEQITLAKDYSLVKDSIVEQISGQRDFSNYEFRGVQKSGDIIVLEVFGTRIMHNQRPAVIGSILDITKRKHAEAEIIKSKELAEKSDKLKTEFLAQMSHEIRTPINAVLSFAGLLKNELNGRIEPELEESFDIMDRAGERIIRTIDLMLNMSQVQAGTFEYKPELFDLYDELAEDIIFDSQLKASKKKIEIKGIKNANPADIYADKYTVGQIVTNLLDNAVKYTNQGSITVTVGINNNSRTFISVKDTGIGISEEYLPNLFKPFTQEETGYTRRFEGNGLGLALVKKYCEMNSAEIRVETTKGRGTEFIVEFRNPNHTN